MLGDHSQTHQLLATLHCSQPIGYYILVIKGVLGDHTAAEAVLYDEYVMTNMA